MDKKYEKRGYPSLRTKISLGLPFDTVHVRASIHSGTQFKHPLWAHGSS